MNRILASKTAFADLWLGKAMIALTTNRSLRFLRQLILVLLLAIPLMLLAATPDQSAAIRKSSRPYTLDVNPSKAWNDTQVDLHPGEKLRFEADGSISA